MGRKRSALIEPKRRAPVGGHQRAVDAPFEAEEAGGGRAERARDDQHIAGPCSGPPGHALRPADASHAQIEALCSRCVSSDNRDSWLVQPVVEFEDPLELGRRRSAKRHREPQRGRTGGGEIAEVDGCGLVAEVVPGRPVEPKVDILDQRILGDDDTVLELGCVVLDSDRKPSPLELGQEAELAQLSQPHRSPVEARVRRRPHGRRRRRTRLRRGSRPHSRRRFRQSRQRASRRRHR
jgi:hypothetical protein